MEERNKKLLLEVAEATEDGRDPFPHEFLVENEVTLDEIDSLCGSIATAIRAFVTCDRDTQAQLILWGTLYKLPGVAAMAVVNLKGEQVRRKLKNL